MCQRPYFTEFSGKTDQSGRRMADFNGETYSERFLSRVSIVFATQLDVYRKNNSSRNGAIYASMPAKILLTANVKPGRTSPPVSVSC